MKGPIAARRDASWYNSPGQSFVYHIWTSDGCPRCNSGVFLSTETRQRAGSIEPELRCKRNGCRQAWPQATPKEQPDGKS